MPSVASHYRVCSVCRYEQGKAIPNPQILSKLDRVLGVHLPRPAKKK